MVKREKKIRLKMIATAHQVRHIKFKQLKKRYRYATGGSGRHFLLRFALRQLQSRGKRGTSKNASTKLGAVWTITSTRQAANSSSKHDIVEEEDVSETKSEGCFEQEEKSSDYDEVEDTPSDQFLLSASFAANGATDFPFGSQKLLQDDSRTAALPSVQCPLEPTQFISSLQSKGVQILKDIELHVSTSNDCKHPPLKDLVFGEPLHGSAPLLLACYYGDVDWVKRIVQCWGVDVNGAAVYFFHPLYHCYSGRLKTATPLIVAASIGNTDIARFLVGEGADVSYKTSEGFTVNDGLTPLFAAAHSRGLLPSDRTAYSPTMIRFLLESGANPNAHPTHFSPAPLWMTESVDTITSLIDHGLNLERLNSNGETALHYWINLESESSDPNRKRDAFTVIKLLVNKGANVEAKDKNGFTVLLAAVNIQNWNAVDYLLEKDGGDRIEKIEAMELAAAIILSKSDNDSEFGQAFRYWRRAFHLRQIEPVPMQKTPLALKSGQAGEWITSEHLERIIKNPLDYKIQSFLARLRICSSKTWGAVLALLNDSFEDCLADLYEQSRTVDLIDVLWATWKAISLFHSDSDDLFWKADGIVGHLTEIFSKLGMDDPLFNAENLILPLEVMLAANEFDFYPNDYDSYDSYNNNEDRYLHTSLQLVAFFAGLPFKLYTLQIRESLRRLVLQNILGEKGRTLLHMVCEDCNVEDLPIIRLLLLSGADPNADDDNGNLPLHVLAYHLGNDAVVQSAAHCLLECGAQLKRANDDGETPADVWVRRHEPEAGLNDLPEWCFKPVTVPTLESLCARIVRSQGIPYDELQLPATLIALVELRELGG